MSFKNDFTKVFESTGGNIVIPNETLKPEYAYNLEAGFAVTAFENKLKIEGNYAYTILNNAIVLRNAQYNGKDSIYYSGSKSRVQTPTNVDKAYINTLYAAVTANFNDHVCFLLE